MVNSQNKKKIVIISQARMTSTRLPKKILKDVEGKPFLWHVVSRLQHVKNADQVVLAIPDTPANDELETFAKANNFAYFRGSEDNLLERHYLTAKAFGADVIVRVPSDNALTEPQIIERIIETHLNSDADYTSNVLEQTFPVGLHAEAFNFSALEKVYQTKTDDYEKEHATPYFYRHPELFKLQNVVAKGILQRPEIRLTTDTQKDLDLIRQIYKNLYVAGSIIKIQDVISFLDKNPELIKSNT